MPWPYFQPCLFELHSTVITNALFIQIQLQPKQETALTLAENSTISKTRGPGIHMLSVSSAPFASPPLRQCFLLHPVVSAKSIYTYRHLLWFPLIISKPIWRQSFCLPLAHLAGTLTSCLVLTGLSMEAELCYLDPPTTHGASAVYHVKPQSHPSLDF